MIRLLRYLFTGDGHIHNWKIIEENEVLNERGTVKGKMYTLQCTVCGNIKNKQVEAE